MGKALIIAEKPSVANDIAKALGGFTKEKDFFENDSYVISSAVGHLLELCLPADLDKMKGKWSFTNLPVIPENFELKPIASSEARLKVLIRLLKRADIDSVINACDAGREGELIFRYIMQHAKCKKPIQRLWLQSMTQDAIREGFERLRSDEQMRPLASAAVCRSESDWLVGINGTRALTALNSREGGFYLTPVGRVQTPTLALVVDREIKIKNFKSKTFWELHATFGAEAGEYHGRWFDESFVKPSKEDESDRKAERIWDQQRALAIVEKCSGKEGIVTEEKKPTSQLSPLLFDLTSLQREANSKFGLSAKRTLQIAQSLYERHKVLTYPRTDSRYLPNDYIPTVKDILKNHSDGALGTFAKKILNEQWVKPNRRIFNGEKVSDHFAIIPTKADPKNLEDMERRIYDLVFKRFLAVFFPAAHFEVTTRITRVEGEPFKTEGKVLREPGWLAIYGKGELDDEEVPAICPVNGNEKVKTEQIESRELLTKAPARFSEATLLSAMEGAGKLVEDEELREAMGKKGLGTPATRAAVIEGLLLEGYIQREGRELIATPKAIALFDLLRAVHLEGLTSPEMTGEWEHKLKMMEQGGISRDQFMTEIQNLTRNIVESARNFTDSGQHAKPFPGKSPDGRPMVETLRYYQTEDASYRMHKVIAGRLISPEEASDLIEKKSIGPLTGFRSKIGRPFAAALKMNGEGKIEFAFDRDPDGASGERPQPVNPESLGPCPLCGGAVLETLSAYYCEKGLLEKSECKFRTGKIILSQEIPRAQVTKLLTQKKTDLLTGFVSQKTRRKFSAFLTMGEDGRSKFEFEPRKPKPGKPATVKDTSAPKSEEKNEEVAKPKKTATPRKKAASKKKASDAS